MDIYLYMSFIDVVTNAFIISNFFVNLIDLKYSKLKTSIIIIIMVISIAMLNLKIIKSFNMSIPQGMVFKPISFLILCGIGIYLISYSSFKKCILIQIYHLIMGYSVEVVGMIYMTLPEYTKGFSIFMYNSHRLLFGIMGNVALCSVSIFYLLLYFKYKNKIKNNYIFLLLILPMLQIFTLQKYTSLLPKDVTTTVLIVGTGFLTLQIIINIIVVNIVMKSILSYDLEQKVFIANLENEKNKYVKNLYTNQKKEFSNMINSFKLQIKKVLDFSFVVKQNQFKDEQVFDKNLQKILKESEDLNNKIVKLLDKQKKIL